jgi:hypothetical protein
MLVLSRESTIPLREENLPQKQKQEQRKKVTT